MSVAMRAAMPAIDATASLAGPTTFELFDEAGCEDWVLRVMLLRRHWRQRHPLAPFFTLGLAAYLDCAAAAGSHVYRNETLRRDSNALIDLHFGPLLNRVAAALSAHFGLPARVTDEAARPGFHIYLPHPAFRLPVASVHRDLQYRDVFPAHTPSDDDLFSFTLPLSTPPGSGLSLWPRGADEPEFLPYRSGTLVVHDGLIQHQAVLACDGDLERVTLQGHGIKTTGQDILLYW
ncbi:hypothetical protein AAHK20_01220 [Trinickia sp. YCB016]